VSPGKLLEPVGARIARLRQEAGYTQQALAERLALSRVAVSHFETGISVPSERTITLLAGLLKIDPPELVEGTDYPEAKADRLPFTAAKHSDLELDLRLLEHDLEWAAQGYLETGMVRARWLPLLEQRLQQTLDSREQQKLRAALKTLRG